MEDKTFGWLTFGGNLKKERRWIGIDLTIAAKSAVFIAPAGLWITLDAGQIKTATYDPNTKEVCLTLEPASDVSRDALLRFEQSVKIRRLEKLSHQRDADKLPWRFPDFIEIKSKNQNL